MNQSGILPCRQMRRRTQAAREKIVGRLQSPRLDPGLEALASLLRDLKLNRSLRLLLHYHCPGPDVGALADVLHEQPREIARPEFAIDCKIEHRQLADVRRHLQPNANRPDLRKLQRWLLAGELALFHGTREPTGAVCVFMTISFQSKGDLVCPPAGSRWTTRCGRPTPGEQSGGLRCTTASRRRGNFVPLNTAQGYGNARSVTTADTQHRGSEVFVWLTRCLDLGYVIRQAAIYNKCLTRFPIPLHLTSQSHRGDSCRHMLCRRDR